MARRALGSVIFRLTTSAYLAASGGTMATPKPAATNPGMLLESSASKLIAGAKPAALQRPWVMLADGVSLLERDERLVRHLLQPDPPAPGEPMAMRDDQSELLIRHARPFETAAAGRHRHKDEIELAAIELRLDLRAVVLHEREPHAGMAQPEAAHQLRDILGAERAQKAERDHPAIGGFEIGELAAAIVDLAERVLHPRQEALARRASAGSNARRGGTAARRGRIAAAPARGSTPAGWCRAVRPRA